MASETVDDYIAGLDGWKADVARQLRALVQETVPDASEAVKWGQPTYEYHGMFCYFKAFKGHINFGFTKGAELDDPNQLLEGSGKSMRHVKITGPEDVNEAALGDLIASAAELNRAEAAS